MSKKNKFNFKKIGFISFAIVLIPFMTVIGLKTAKEISGVSKGARQNIDIEAPKEAIKIKRFYTIITNHQNAKDDITNEEIKTLAEQGKFVCLDDDKDTLLELLKLDIQSSVPSSDQLKIKKDDYGIVRVDHLLPNFKVLNVDGKSIWDDSDYSLYAQVPKEPSQQQFDKTKVIKMTSVGDIILGRQVYAKMMDKGFISPFFNVSEKLTAADVTFGNLETPLSDSKTPPKTGMEFLAPQKAIEGILASGFDVLGLANNHSTNFGNKVFEDTLQLLKQNKIEYVGGGYNFKEAKDYKVLNIKNKRFSFLNVNSIAGAVVAKDNSSGIWHINIDRRGKMEPKQIEELLDQVREARKDSDFVTVMIHWGKEYTRDPKKEMKDLAHQVIDAGADLIVGTHPHWVQGLEIYDGKLITYSLGNFIFDQDWSKETKQGLILDTIYYKDKLVSFKLTPVLIEDFHQPRILLPTEKDFKAIMDAVWTSSVKVNPGL